MKTEKMKLMVKRLPNDGLWELWEIVINELNFRKDKSKTIQNKGVPSGKIAKADN